jgi:hypothetical protein
MLEWKLSPHDRPDKSLVINGPLRLYVDYDDVDTDAVDAIIPEFLRVLNEHFHPPVRYTCPEYYGDDEYEAHESSKRYLPAAGTCSVCGRELEEIALDES